MANSTTNLDTITVGQASKEVTANELFDAGSPATLFGRRASTSVGLTWGYYGGEIVLDGVLTAIVNGTRLLTASLTNYLEATRAGVVSANTTGFTAGSVALYTIVCGSASVTTYTDHRAWAALPGVGSMLSKSVAGNSNVTLTAAEARAGALKFTGALTGNINVIVPGGPQQWAVYNSTSGSYTLTVKTASGTGFAVTQGGAFLVIADGTNVVGLSGANGGLTRFTEGQSSASPNGSVTVVSLTASDAGADTDFVINPKRFGAILRQVPDSTSTGGNKRGLNAVDLQASRSNANQVASGESSAIVSGNNNRASGFNAFVGAGTTNSATGDYSSIVGGENNAASGDRGVVVGGDTNTASGGRSAVLGGRLNTANGTYSVATGYQATARGLEAAVAHSAGALLYAGDAQTMMMVLAKRTTSATQATMTAAGASASSGVQMTLSDSSSYIVTGEVVARDANSTDTAGWTFTALLRRGSGVGTVAMVALSTPTLIGADAGAVTWVLVVDADTTYGCLRLRVTGQAGKTINWVSTLRATQVAV